MILCSFCPGKKEIVMTSILRDLYVAIPGYGWNRLNAAYAFGGTALLIVVGVALDTMKQVESMTLMRHYQGFMK